MRHNREAFERGGWCRGCCTARPRATSPPPSSARRCARPSCWPRRGRRDDHPRLRRADRARRHEAGTSYVFSSQGCNPLEETAAAMGGTPFWHQLYWSTDEPLVDSMIQRAERAAGRRLSSSPRHHHARLAPAGPRPGLAAVRPGPGHRAVHLRPAVHRRRAPADRRGRGRGGAAEKVDVTLEAVRSLVSITRSYPGASSTTCARRSRGRRSRRSSTSTPTRACRGTTWPPCAGAPRCRSCSRACCTRRRRARLRGGRRRDRRLQPRRAPGGHSIARWRRWSPSATGSAPTRRSCSTAASHRRRRVRGPPWAPTRACWAALTSTASRWPGRAAWPRWSRTSSPSSTDHGSRGHADGRRHHAGRAGRGALRVALR